MEISKETKNNLEKDKKRLESEIKVMVHTARELKDEIDSATHKFNQALAGMSEKVETGIKIDLQLAEAERDDEQVKIDGYGSKGRKFEIDGKNYQKFEGNIYE